MPTVTATLKMFDAMTKPLQNITNSMNLMIRAMEDMQRAADRNVNLDRTLTAAKKQLAAAEAEIRKSIDEATRAQQRFDQSVKQAKTSVDSLTSSIKKWAAGIATAYISAKGIRTALEAADQFTSQQARLGLIVDEGQTVEQLRDMIKAASRRSMADVNAMSDTVARLGLLARDAFQNTTELVAFTEIMQKAFKVSGASIQEQSAAMYQLSQAMAAGALQGDEFRSIMENAPMLADAIAKFVGVSRGELKKLASEGKITSDVIKGALFAAADDINKKFEQMPKTFGDVFQGFKNEAFNAFEPVFQRMNEWLNSAQGAAMIQSISNAIYFAAQAANLLLGALIWIADVIYSNWGIIEPILIAIGSALAFWALTQIPLLVSRLWLMVQPILASAAAWAMANLPILLVGAAIGLLIYALYKWSDVTAEVIGFIGGIFGTLFAFLYNGFAVVANTFLSVAEFFANVWRDPVYAVKKLFYDLVINVLRWMENLARGIENIINSIPGIEISITSGLSNLLGRLEGARDSLTSEADVVRLKRYEQLDYGKAFDFGQRIGRSVGQFASDGIQKAFDKIGGMFDPQKSNKMLSQLDGLKGLGKGVGDLAKDGIGKVGKVGSVGRIEDTVDISNEDIKLLRELAEMKAIQNFVTLTPTVNVTTGDIRNDADIDTIIRRIEETLEREIAASAQGVYG